jgi:hypothetical protein
LPPRAVLVGVTITALLVLTLIAVRGCGG